MARRYARRSDPPVPKIQRIELDDTNLPLRLLGLGIAIAVAAAAFGYFVSTLFSGDPGWQEITASHTETGITAQFTLNYYLGGKDRSVSAEKKLAAQCYGDSANEAYRILSKEAFEGYQNIAYLNAHPNETVTVDPLLYGALETLQASGCRYPYLAPLFSMYDNLLGVEGDDLAMQLDPAVNEDAGRFAAETAAFAAQPDAVQMLLLGNQQVMLKVSDAYLDFLRNNEVETVFDFGILRNSFILDAIADALEEAGLTSGILSSMEGYTRTLRADDYSLNVYGCVNGGARHLGIIRYEEPTALTTFRAFPMTSQDTGRFYTYEDGTVRVPYLRPDGGLGASVDSLTVFSGESCAASALAALAAMTADSFRPEMMGSCAWVACENGAVRWDGTGISVEVLP